MKTQLLFPNQFKRIGWILLVPASILGILLLFFDFSPDFLTARVFAIYDDNFFQPKSHFSIVSNPIADELAAVLFILGALLIAFSREKQEDEYIAKIRLESLVWSVYVNYAVLVFCLLFFYGPSFLTIMLFNMFTVLIFFIIRFYYMLYRSKNSLNHEE